MSGLGILGLKYRDKGTLTPEIPTPEPRNHTPQGGDCRFDRCRCLHCEIHTRVG